MRSFMTGLFILMAGAASAHPGHIAEIAGHNHWLAGAAIGAAILLGLREAAKRRKEAAQESNEGDDAEGEEEAA